LWEKLQNLLRRSQVRENEDLIAIRGYSIIRQLGEGAQGAVYLAQRESTGEQVALKVMLPAVLGAQKSIDKFLREAQNTKALNHPHVVQLKDAGYSEDIFFFTLEYCEGGSLADFIWRRGGKLDLETAIPIIKQVLKGLAYAHNVYLPEVQLANSRVNTGRGLVHRDLKPGNILLTNIDGSPMAKIADYGLSKSFDLAGLSGLTVMGTAAGGPCFMPRQQVTDFKNALPEVDVWAAAAVLYYMLAGTYPRNFDAKPEPWLVILQTNAVPILERNPFLPKDLAEVIDLGLIDKPQIHFKTAAEFLQALSQVI